MNSGKFPQRPASYKVAAGHAHVSVDTIRRRVRTGQLTAYRLGPQIVRVDLDEVEALFSVGSDVS